MTKYAVALGYGFFDESNASYKAYLDAFAEYANKNSAEITVLSGGRTNPSNLSESEASTMYGYLKPLLKTVREVHLEEESMTTPQNIASSKKFVIQAITKPSSNEVTVFSDNIRMVKVMWFVQHYWFGRSRTEIAQYFVDFGYKFYKEHLSTEKIGEMMHGGLKYANVTILPGWTHTRVDSAISQQTGTVLEIESLYDGALESKLMRNVRTKLGFE